MIWDAVHSKMVVMLLLINLFIIAPILCGGVMFCYAVEIYTLSREFLAFL